MDINSGRIFDAPVDDKPKSNAIEVEGYPNPDCIKCYGRGFRKVTFDLVPCGCLGTTDQKRAKLKYTLNHGSLTQTV